MPRRIRPRRPYRLYIAEWRDRAGLTQEAIAQRLGTTHVTVSRWERGEVLLNTDVMAALAEVLGIRPVDLYRHPDRESLDALLGDQPDDVLAQAIRVLSALRKQ